MDPTTTPEALLSVADLTVRFYTPEGEVNAVNGVSFALAPGESLGVVGESGSGKSQLFLALMGLLASNGRASGAARFAQHDLLTLRTAQRNRLRGREMAMIFQDPMTSLNPYLRVSTQMTEVLTTHEGLTRRAARRRALEMMERVRIPEAGRRFSRYPHEFSGGMRQRLMIAMALLCRPKLLIADEPTTALDVTLQAQILALLAELQRELSTAIVLITHDLGVVAGLCQRVLVMYAGRIAEQAPVEELFYRPQHPYTEGLLASTPRIDKPQAELIAIPGQPPNLQRLPPGCPFAPRCGWVKPLCREILPPLEAAVNGEGRADPSHLKACLRPHYSPASLHDRTDP